MKKKIVTILCCTAFVTTSILAMGCGKTDKTAPASTVNTETTSSPEESVSDSADSTVTQGMPEESESMQSVMMALAMAGYGKNVDYGLADTKQFWTACTYLISSDGLVSAAADEQDDGTIIMPGDYVKEFANALFAEYDGNTQALPDVPKGLNLVNYDADTDNYTFVEGDYGLVTLEITDCTTTGDGSYTVHATLKNSEDSSSISDYEIGMKDTTFSIGKPIYHYMITSFKQTKSYVNSDENTQIEKDDTTDSSSDTGKTTDSDTTDTSDSTASDNTDASYPDDPSDIISQDKALEMIESKYGESGSADPDTGNLMSYAFEEMTQIDGTEYYNFRVSWLVVDENGKADHSSYLENIVVSTDGKTMKECTRNESGTWQLN